MTASRSGIITSWAIVLVLAGAVAEPATNLRSIGSAGIYNTGQVTVVNGQATVTGILGTLWVTNNRGRGDYITITGQGTYTIQQVNSETTLLLTTPFTGTGGSYTYVIGRKFATIDAWRACIDTCGGCGVGGPAVATASLVADNRQEVGILYKDGQFTGLGLEGGSITQIGAAAGDNTCPTRFITTDATRNVVLTADGVNRHYGVTGAGVVINGMNGANKEGMIRVWAQYTRIEWVEIKNVCGGACGAGSVGAIKPEGASATGLVIENVILHDNKVGVLSSSSVATSWTIRNAFIYNSTGRGIDAQNLTDTLTIENVTLLRNGGRGVERNGGPITARNVISLHNGGGDFDTGITQSNNRSSDATAAGAGSLTAQTATDVAGATANRVVFKNCPSGIGACTSAPSGFAVGFEGGNYNLLLKASTVNTAVDTGTNLSASFARDIETQGRPGGPAWDIGADELNGTTAVTLQSFTAAPGDGRVELSWTTASELNNLGFHLHRSESSDGPYTQITSELIPGLGSSPTGKSYSYVDSGLVNGRAYFYKLEDVESTGRTQLHGPVSATPSASAAGDGGSSPSDSGSAVAYGNPPGVVLREVERSSRHVVLELLTGGFYASPAEDGRVRLSVPGFESASQPGDPELPMRRALVEVVAGRKVHLASVVASDVVRFPGLHPSSEGVPEVEVSEDGSVRPSRRPVREHGYSSVFPAESARLLGSAFQGETKKAEVLLFPLRFDGTSGELELSRRLLVRLEFAGTEEGERSLGGSRGRKVRARRSHRRGAVVAQLQVKDKGLYRASYEELFPPLHGRARGMSTESLRLSRQGESVAFHVEPDAEVFGPGSSLYFLSEGSSLNAYADAVYELETNTPGVLMAVEKLESASGVVSEHFALLEREQNTYYQAGLLDAPDLWLWDVVVSPGTKRYPFSVEQLAASSSASHLSVALQGASDFLGVVDHHVRVSVNGIGVGETTWDGKVPLSLDVEVPPGVLHEGENALEIQDVGDTGAAYSMVFLNRFSLRYPRRLVAVQGKLEGRFDSSGQAEVQGLSSSSALVDTTETPRWLRGATPTTSGLVFPVQGGRSYLATSVVLHPEVRVVQTSTLKSDRNQADYLLLAPQAFLQAAQPLLDRRGSQGLVTKAVSVEEVYEQFGHGEIGPEAIKEFLEYAYHSWASPSPRYVVLLGDASYDPKNYLKTGVKNWIPGFPVKTSYLWTVSDPAYAAVNGDDLVPDMAIGRLPASSVEEAETLVQKVLAFEGGGGDFSGRAVLVADNADQAGKFEQDADEIASTVLASRSPQRIYLSQLGGSTRTSIREAFDQGASLLSYVGHGATVIWANENVFNNWDVPTLAPQPQQPLLLTMNCLNGFFHFPPLNTLSEALLKAEGKGVIGAFSPSGLSANDAAHLYHKALLGEIVSGRHERLGDAVLAAQEAFADSGAFPELLSIYHLFGDPALRIF